MSNPSSLVDLFKDILEMPYYKNSPANDSDSSGKLINRHEDAIEKKFIEHGYKKWDPPKKLKKKDKNESSFLSDMPAGDFITQPFGKNENPDFYIKSIDGKLVPVEAKSSSQNSTAPLYNSGGIKQNYLYVYTSEKTNKTTIYLGNDIITLEQEKLINEHINLLRKLDEELNKNLNTLDVNHRGISFYTRPMIGQRGDKTYTNYFNHEFRENIEKKALHYLM